MGGERPTYVPRDGATRRKKPPRSHQSSGSLSNATNGRGGASEDDATGTEVGSVVGTSEGTGNSAGQAMLPRVRGATGQGRQQ